MCGICGYYSSKLYDDKVIKEMNEAIIHRGPDSAGFFNYKNFNMAMRRLSIIDLDTGNQPIYNAKKNLSIVFNGEIYNFKEIKKKLILNGVKFKTKGDTEVILLGYEFYGTKIFSMLNGMFAIAIFNTQTKELLLARDRLGIKPLYYYCDDDNFIFGSEIKSILKHPVYKKELNYSALHSLLKYKYILGNNSLFRNIYKLKKGCYVSLDKNLKLNKPTCYWQIGDYLAQTKIKSLKESKNLIENSIYEAVNKRLISDVPLGIFLSGGIDSAILTNVASQITNTKINTFSIGFESKTYNELSLAKLTAKFNNTNHHEFVVRPENILQLIKKLVYAIDEPLGDYAIIPNYFVSQFASKYVKVALSGSGADEIFGGYERYWLNKGSGLIAIIPTFAIRFLNNAIKYMPGNDKKKSVKRRLSKFLTNCKKPLGYRYDASFHLLSDIQISNLLTDSVNKEILLEKQLNLSQYFDKYPKNSFLTSASFTDFNSILPNNYLIKEDRMSMINSLEVRVPFLDHKLIQDSFKIQDALKLHGFKTKRILKDIYKNRIHKEILNRPKQGFEAPMRIWLKNEIKNEVHHLLLNSSIVANGIINLKYLKTILNEHENGLADHSKLLFTLISFEFWYCNNFN